jgi:glycosyltransferase involved in cell wall biosynthesis
VARERPTVDVLHVAFGGLGGHTGVILPLSAELRRDGLATGVIAYAPEAALRQNAAAWSDLPVVVPVARRGRLDLRALLEVAWATRRLRPRVVVCHTLKPVPAAFVGMLAARRRPVLVLVEHQQIDLRRPVDEVRTGLTLPWLRAIVFLTPDARARYRFRRVPLRALRRSTVIPTGVDTERFSPRPGPRPDRPFTVGMACRLIPTKDLPTLIEAIALVRAGGRDVVLEVAGEGPDRCALEALVARLDVREAVRFAGHLDERTLADHLRGLDLYVQSTLGETLSTALLQAYATGLPCVGSAVAGVTDLVRDDIDGCLVAPRSAPALAELIVALVDDDDRRNRLGASARQRAETEFAMPAMAAGYRTLLAGVDPGGPW